MRGPLPCVSIQIILAAVLQAETSSPPHAAYVLPFRADAFRRLLPSPPLTKAPGFRWIGLAPP